MKKIIILMLSIVLFVAGYNYFTIFYPLKATLKKDFRNNSFIVYFYYDSFLLIDNLVMDVREIGIETSSADVTRAFFQAADKLKDKSFSKVIFANSGDQRFYINGEDFNKIGQEYSFQNPVYTLRKLPSKIYHLDERKAFGTWTGGLIGVLGKEMGDLNDFHRQWLSN